MMSIKLLLFGKNYLMKTSNRDYFLNYLSYLTTILVNLFMLPLILLNLPESDLGVWYLLTAFSALALLIETGMSSTITRFVTYSLSGFNSSLSKDLTNPKHINSEILLFQNVYYASRKLMKIMGFISFVIFYTILFAYVFFSDNFYLLNNYILEISFFSLNFFFLVVFSYQNPVFKGLGKISVSSKIAIFSKLLTFVILIFLVIIGSTLLLYIISIFIVNIVSIALSSFILINQIDYKKKFLHKSEVNNVIKLMLPNNISLSVVGFSSWLTSRLLIILSSTYFGLEITGKIGFTQNLLALIGDLSAQYYNVSFPEMISLKIKRMYNELKILLAKSIVFFYVLNLLGIFSFLFIFQPILIYFGYQQNFLPIYTTIFMTIIYGLELNHSIFSNFTTIDNKILFLKASIYSGLSNVILNYLYYSFFSPDILGILLIQFLIHLSFNNWYWPRLVLKNLKISFREIVILGFIYNLKEIKSYFIKKL